MPIRKNYELIRIIIIAVKIILIKISINFDSLSLIFFPATHFQTSRQWLLKSQSSHPDLQNRVIKAKKFQELCRSALDVHRPTSQECTQGHSHICEYRKTTRLTMKMTMMMTKFDHRDNDDDNEDDKNCWQGDRCSGLDWRQRSGFDPVPKSMRGQEFQWGLLTSYLSHQLTFEN